MLPETESQIRFTDNGATDALSRTIDRWIGKCSEEPTTSQILKRQRKVAKYERELFRIGDEVQALSRFANAQVVAFRKIVKKYKKWTGSTTLGSRFSEDVLSNPKSFTRRDFAPLQRQHDEILQTLREAIPQLSEPSSPSSDEYRPSSSATVTQFEPLPPPSKDTSSTQYQPTSQVKYWNEYDDGSEAGGPEDDYAIYIDPEESSIFPGFGYVQGVLSLPFEKVKHWFHLNRAPEREPLLADRPGTTHGYFSTSADSDEEGYASSSDFPSHGFVGHYAFPSIGEQKVQRYRENVLFWVTVGCYAASFALLAISSVLISTGRHKLRVEVDAAVTVGVAFSLLSACSALGATLYRRDPLTMSYRVMVGSTFIASCLLNGMLLVLVVGNAP